MDRRGDMSDRRDTAGADAMAAELAARAWPAYSDRDPAADCAAGHITLARSDGGAADDNAAAYRRSGHRSGVRPLSVAAAVSAAYSARGLVAGDAGRGADRHADFPAADAGLPQLVLLGIQTPPSALSLRLVCGYTHKPGSLQRHA
ncbi:hypothetical protein COLO4_02265 [Corchorus olitorius]|uniref:Uncharacterized protein n=1 Tax=Corchorus olitorius TaxID=93759 RepID=A0A1R3L1D0_9ROSI|nr:hypothetical protein COLO4_02265 [Corchorus olitorius]